MRRSATSLSFLFAALLAIALALAPGLAFARAGGGFSTGSRGSRSYSAPPMTNTAPFAAAPLQRSITPPPASNAAPSYRPSPAFGGGYGGRSSFTSGLMGGLIGAGIGGLLFGGGMFHGGMGLGGFFGLLIQLFLLVMLGRFLWRLFTTRGAGGGGYRPAMAGSGGPMPIPALLQRNAMPGGNQGGGTRGQPIQLAQGDFQAFEQLLQGIQAAWSAHDLNALRSVASPEMASYFSEQLGEQTSRGVRNMVTAVRLEQGDLSEAWAEPGREYATVAMRFSMLDVTRDGSGRVVDGSADERVTVTELWTFLRAPGARWILSAIQQGR